MTKLRDSLEDFESTSAGLDGGRAQQLAPLVSIRALGANHRARLMTHLISLDPDDRFLRFGYVANDQQISRYVENLDFSTDAIFGVFNRRLDIVAMAHLAIPDTHTGSRVAEFGVSVAPALRGRGIGGRLYERAVLHARNEGIDVLAIQALAGNSAMLAIARKRGATVLRQGVESEALLQLPKPDLESRLHEIFEEYWAHIHYSAKVHAKAISQVFCAVLGLWRPGEAK